MNDKLNLKKIYNSFNSPKITTDINLINLYISEILNINNQPININDLEKFLCISNKLTILIDKLFSFSRLHLYLNTNNLDAIILLKKVEKIELNFKKSQSSFLKYLSNTSIEEFCSASPYINKHKYYIKKLLNTNNFNITTSHNSKYEQKYNKLISSHTITINKINYPINYTKFDFLIDADLKKIEKKYFIARDNNFNNKKNIYSNLLYKIKKETMNLSNSLGYSSPLEMSLSLSGLTSTILDTVLNSIEKHKDILSKYLVEDLNFTSNDKSYTIEEAKNIIVESFSKFDKSLADLTNTMFNNGQIDLSNNKNKIIGSCHLKILSLKESRIIGHFNGKIKDIFQIAHELGHAYQNNIIMHSQPPLNSHVPIATCEIISMFCELLVLDYLLKNSQNNSSKQLILRNFINYFIQATLDVYSRFLFENKLFKLISQNTASFNYEILNSLMLDAQKTAYNANTTCVDKNLWIFKPHFYSISTPYYNYSYALGILFAFILFDKYIKNNNKNFVNSFKKFCKLSGCSEFSKLSSIFNINLWDENSFNASFNTLINYINTYMQN